MKIDEILKDIGYNENFRIYIINELNKLFEDINFEKIERRARSAADLQDTDGLIDSLKELMSVLENKGIYRPDAPVPLIKLLVNGLNLKNENIFHILERSAIPEKEILKEIEFLASCAAITQLGYILLKCLSLSNVRSASSGEHVFLVIDSFLQNSEIFVDFSIDSIVAIDVGFYERRDNSWRLTINNKLSPPDMETTEFLTTYYSLFRLAEGTGLSHNIHNNLGLAYDRIGMFEEAIEELQEALRLNPDYIEVHNNLAVAFEKMGHTDKAEKELLEAIRLNPGYVEAHNNLGSIYARAGRLEEAILEVKEALRINPGYAQAHNNLGDIYARKNMKSEAMNEFQEALRLDPNYSIARNNIGNLYFESGMYDEAIREFQEALRIDPDFLEAYYPMGLAYYELKSFDRASQAFIRAVYYFPDLMDSVPDKLILKVRQGVSRLR